MFFRQPFEATQLSGFQMGKILLCHQASKVDTHHTDLQFLTAKIDPWETLGAAMLKLLWAGVLYVVDGSPL